MKQKNTMYVSMIENSQNAIEKTFNKKYTMVPHHSVDAYKKSLIKECKKVFEQEVSQNLYSKFRNENNCERILFLYYALAIKQGDKKIISKIDSYLPLYKKIQNYLLKKYKQDSIVIQANNEYINEIFERYKPILGCINDKPNVTVQDRERVNIFYETLFPKKSSFEK